jgi:anti-sigma regulatory factor (Ser/Thr protein kinase)
VEHGILKADRVAQSQDHATDGFHHEAFLYAGREEYLDGTASFIREGLAAGEPALVVVDGPKIAWLRDEFGADGEDVQFADMALVGSNPARIIQAWRDFVDQRGDTGSRVRGIGEPISPDRSPAELVECQRHETLLNLVFGETPAFRLMCPYDTDALDEWVVEEALRSHPVVASDGHRIPSSLYGGIELATAPFSVPLPEAPRDAKELYFEAPSLAALRQYVALRAADAEVEPARIEDLLLAVNEVATNSLRHGAGAGYLRIWEEPDALVCEVRDEGVFDQPLAGRLRPTPAQIGGYGLWVANQVCDLVQVRSLPGGTAVRLRMRRR